MPVAATNNLNFGNPERPEIMAQLVEAIEGIAEACAFFETPITGGNVSLYNETLGEGIWPTPGAGHRRADEDRAAGADSFHSAKARTVMLLGGFGACDEHAVRRNAIRESRSEQAVGPAARARYGLRKARARRDSGDD